MKESEILELKRSTAELKEAVISIVAILNKHQKGELYFGVRNDGIIFGQDVTENTIREILREEHRLNILNAEDDFSIKNQNDILEAELETSNTYNLLITSIAAISLLVGGIGIFASMLMSVRERTNEIGLRKAIGAGRKEILIQFLLESAVMGITGGILGIIIGIGTILYYEGLKRIKAAQVSALEFSTPFFAAILGFFILREFVTIMQIIGILLLFVGIYYLSKKE